MSYWLRFLEGALPKSFILKNSTVSTLLFSDLISELLGSEDGNGIRKTGTLLNQSSIATVSLPHSVMYVQ